MAILDSPPHSRGGLYVGSLLVAWSPFIVLFVSGNPFGIVCAAASLSLGVASVIHAQLGGLASNDLEVDVEGDRLLKFFPRLVLRENSQRQQLYSFLRLFFSLELFGSCATRTQKREKLGV